MTPTDPRSAAPSGRFLNAARQNRELLPCLASAPPRLVVIGNFNAGKSTLINALLGKRLLPAALKPTTGAVIRIVRGAEERTTVRFLDGRMRSEAGTALLEEYAVIGAPGNSEFVQDIQVETDSPLLDDDRMIVDVPGMEDDPDRYKTILREVLPADLVLSVHDVGIQMPLSEQTFLQEELIAHGCASICVIWNKCNLLEEEQQEAALAGAVRRLQGVELRPLEPLRSWYRLDALPELRKRLAGETASASFQTFQEDIQEALNPESPLLKQTRATRIAMLLAADGESGGAGEGSGAAQIGSWRDTAHAAAERLLATAARMEMGNPAARLTPLVAALAEPGGNLLLLVQQVTAEAANMTQSLEQSLAGLTTGRQQLEQDYAYVRGKFEEARRLQAELPPLIARYREEMETVLLRSFLVRVQAVLQHLRSTVETLPDFAPPSGYQAVTVLVQSPLDAWRQDKASPNSAYQVLLPLATGLSAEIQGEIIRMLGMVSAISGAEPEANGPKERGEADRILGRVVSTVSRRLIDQEALLSALVGRMPPLAPAALVPFKGVSKPDFLPNAEHLLMTTLAASEAQIRSVVTTVLAGVEKSILAFVANALAGIEKRWEEMLGSQDKTDGTDRLEMALQQTQADLTTLQEIYYNFQAALTTFRRP